MRSEQLEYDDEITLTDQSGVRPIGSVCRACGWQLAEDNTCPRCNWEVDVALWHLSQIPDWTNC